MSFIEPGQPVERKIRSVASSSEIPACERVDCSERREELSQLASANAMLEARVKEMQQLLETNRSKVDLVRRGVAVTEQQNGDLREEVSQLEGQIQERKETILQLQAKREEEIKYIRFLQDDIAAMREEEESGNGGSHMTAQDPWSRSYHHGPQVTFQPLSLPKLSSNNHVSSQELDSWARDHLDDDESEDEEENSM